MLTESTIEHFDSLRAGYLTKLAEQTAALRHQMQSLGTAKSGGLDHNAVAPVISQLHNLAGSGETFGLPVVSDWARRGEQILTEALDGHLEWNDSTQQVLDDTLLALVDAVNEARQAFSAPAEQPQTDNDASNTNRLDTPRRVLLFARDHSLDETATALMQFGYQLEQLKSMDALARHLQEYRPDILLMPFSPVIATQLLEMRQNLTHLPPIVFFSRQQDFATRLAALRAGGRALLAEPPDSDELAAVLAGLCLPPSGADYRVAVLDPDTEQGRYHSLLLEGGGMNITLMQHPQTLLDNLVMSAFEAIVSPLYLPECDGLELAALLRQIPATNQVPVIFLAPKPPEKSPDEPLDEQQIHVIRASGNDYLPHPIKAGQLVQSVSSHARTCRAENALSQRDSLTGLFNYHTTLKTLDRETLRAQRQQAPLSIGLLSMDHFKRVNDGFGYAAGNSAIKSLAHLFTQRLRRSDIVGRLEGNTFLIIFPATSAQDAQQVVETIRSNFGKLQHSGEQGEFTISLSGGVTQFKTTETASNLLARADTALYHAKRSGRNQIKLA